MREVKYRGKVDGVWWYVSPDHNPGLFGSFWYIADRDTVGQYIGLKDKQGKEIWEGDIIKHPPYWHDDREVHAVKDIHMFCGDYGNYGDIETEIEVIGNIYENGDLLK